MNSSKNFQSILANGSTIAAAMFSRRMHLLYPREPAYLGHGDAAPHHPPADSPSNPSGWTNNLRYYTSPTGDERCPFADCVSWRDADISHATKYEAKTAVPLEEKVAGLDQALDG